MKSQARTAVQQRWIAPLPDGHIHFARVKAPTGTPQQQIEIRRHYAYDGVTLAVEGDSFTQDAGRGREFAFPQARANDGDGSGSDFIFTRRENTADHRLHP